MERCAPQARGETHTNKRESVNRERELPLAEWLAREAVPVQCRAPRVVVVEWASGNAAVDDAGGVTNERKGGACVCHDRDLHGDSGACCAGSRLRDDHHRTQECEGLLTSSMSSQVVERHRLDLRAEEAET